MRLRFISVMALLLLVAAVFAPVAAQDDVVFPIELPEQIAEGREVTFTVDGKPSDANPEALEQWNAQVERFQALYPNVTVEGVEYSYNPETFLALVAGGQVPTLFGTFYTEPQKLIALGVPENLTPYYEEYGIRDFFNPRMLDIVTGPDGNIYGIPGFAYAQGIAYDIAALQEAGFENPPATWEELATMAQALTNRDENRAGFMFWSEGGGGTGWHFTNIAYGFGATQDDLVRDNGDGTFTATFGEGPAVEAMKFIKDLRWTYNALPLELATGDDLIPALPTGRTAMIMFPGDQLGRIRTDYPEVDIANFGYAPMPAGPNGRVSLTGGSATMIYSGATDDQKEAAFVYQLWRQMGPEEVKASIELQNATQGSVGIPVLQIYSGEYQEAYDAVREPFIVMPVENYTAFNEAVANGEVTLIPEPPFAQDFYVAVADVVTAVLTDENADVEQLMADAAAAFQSGILDQAATAG